MGGAARVFDKDDFLHRIGDEDLAREMLRVFVSSDFPRLSRNLQDGVANRDPRAIERAAHGLNGALGQLGATAAQKLASQLELSGANESLNEIQSVYDQFVHEAGQVVLEINRLNDQNDWNG